MASRADGGTGSAGVDWRQPHAVIRYGLAIGFVAAALGVTFLVGYYQPHHPALYAFYAAMVASAWLGGIGPGCVAVVLSTLAVEFFWLAPLNSFGVESRELPEFVAFIVCAGIGIPAWRRHAGTTAAPKPAITEEPARASQPPVVVAAPPVTRTIPRTAAPLPADLRQLESEAIGIMREVVAEFRHPVMLYSIGKDSSVLLHLALKAFHPAKPPFPLLHVDTKWKFREMIAFRDETARRLGLDLLVHTNQEGLDRGIDPIASGSALHTQVMKTEALRQALDRNGFDAAFGGARRDEEKSRAKERIFSIRNAEHAWNPRAQRPELWHLFNTRLGPGESMRVFPLSNWTELDIWRYIECENIPVVPLYFSKERPVVRRSDTWIMVDDDRLTLAAGETPRLLRVRFRTLGCYPLSGAIESAAASVSEIVAELRGSHQSERQGRLIDGDEQASMERKKREGYF